MNTENGRKVSACACWNVFNDSLNYGMMYLKLIHNLEKNNSHQSLKHEPRLTYHKYKLSLS